MRDGALLYYGTADATSWFLIVLDALGDAALARRARAGVARRRGLAGAGAGRGRRLVRYGPRRGGGGLAQQGWRDAMAPVEGHPHGGGILRPDGSAPRAPLADADCQAAAVAALDALARLDPGGDWPARAAALRAAVADWGPDVLAVEAGGEAVPGAGSSLGWLLWAGALAGDACGGGGRPAVGSRRPHGLRRATLAASDGAFRPHAYHRGAVWPFDSWLGYGGLRAAGRAPRPSASAPACSRRSTGSAARQSSMP